MAYSSKFSKHTKDLKNFRRTRSFSDNRNSFPYFAVKDVENSKFENMSETALGPQAKSDISDLMDKNNDNYGLAIIGDDIVSFRTLKIFGTDNRLLLAKPLVDRDILDSYAKSHWDFSFYKDDKLLLSSIQDEKALTAQRITLQEASLQDRFRKINKNWSTIGDTHSYIRKIKLQNSNTMALLEFDPKNIYFPMYLKVLFGIPVMFCFILILLGIHIFNYHEKEVLSPLSGLHMELARLKSNKFHEIKNSEWHEIQGIVQNLNTILRNINTDQQQMKLRIDKNLADYGLIKEQINVDDFEFYALLEISSKYIQDAEELIQAEKSLNNDLDSFKHLKSMAVSLEINSLVNACENLELSVNTENPINKDNNIMDNYVDLLELLHKYKLIRDDLGFSVDPPTYSRHRSTSHIKGSQIIQYVKSFCSHQELNVVCNIADDDVFDYSSLSKLHLLLTQFKKQENRPTSVELQFDRSSNNFILNEEISVKAKSLI